MAVADPETIQRLVSQDELESAIDTMRSRIDRASDARLDQELLMHASRLSRTRDRTRKGLVSEDEESKERTRIGYALLELLNSLDDDARGNAARSDRVTVFMSYNHADRKPAERLAQALAERGLEIRIDSDSMQPGESIRTFIERAIRSTDATICVVSTASLLSSWVGVETLMALRRETFDDARRFIAVYIDEAFLASEFRLEATQRIDAWLAKLDALVTQYHTQRLDPSDLNDEITRLHELRHGLGEILSRLRGSLLLDIRDEAFDASAQRVAETLLRPTRK